MTWRDVREKPLGAALVLAGALFGVCHTEALDSFPACKVPMHRELFDWCRADIERQ